MRIFKCTTSHRIKICDHNVQDKMLRVAAKENTRTSKSVRFSEIIEVDWMVKYTKSVSFAEMVEIFIVPSRETLTPELICSTQNSFRFLQLKKNNVGLPTTEPETPQVNKTIDSDSLFELSHIIH